MKRITDAIKDGTIWHKVCRKLRRGVGLYRLKGAAADRAELAVEYARLKKKYGYVLRKQDVPKEQTNSRVIWLCWFSGFDTAPELVKSCQRTIQKKLSSYKVVLLTDENLHQYVELPDYIEKKRAAGVIPPAQYSDLVRIALICRYGGLWLDATVLCTDERFVEYIMEQPLFVFKEVLLVGREEQPTVASNWLIGGTSNQPILLMTQKLLHEYWRRERRLRNYFIFHLFFTMATEVYERDWKNVPTFSNVPPHLLQFEMTDTFDPNRWKQIKHSAAIHKLNHHIDYSGEADSYYHRLIRDELD